MQLASHGSQRAIPKMRDPFSEAIQFSLTKCQRFQSILLSFRPLAAFNSDSQSPDRRRRRVKFGWLGGHSPDPN
jgi:hypothetical protein